MEKMHQSQRQALKLPLATCILEVDLGIIQQNFLKLQHYCQNIDEKTLISGVVKANAYGVGLFEITQALYDVGCRIFYVATPNEGVILREKYTDIKIYILDGLFIGHEAVYQQYKLTPCLASINQVQAWHAFCQKIGKNLACILHFNTGINRLGMALNDYFQIDLKTRNQLNIDHILSHFASADMPNDPQNMQQVNRFKKICNALPDCVRSFGNSAALALKPLHNIMPDNSNILRPGIAIFGVKPCNHYPIDLKPAISLRSRILQISNLNHGDMVGYNHDYICSKPMRVAVVAAGYGDGIFRSLSTSNNFDNRPIGYFKYNGYQLPILGKISMDMTVVDISELPDGMLQEGDFVEIFGKTTPIDTFANWAGTISYEILTNIGERVEKRYLKDGKS